MAKMAQKWIDTKHKYIPYKLPDGASCYEDDMDKEISCCVCGKKIKYGDSFTSRRIHTTAGIGFCECYECYFDYQTKQPATAAAELVKPEIPTVAMIVDAGLKISSLNTDTSSIDEFAKRLEKKDILLRQCLLYFNCMDNPPIALKKEIEEHLGIKFVGHKQDD